MKNCLFFIVLMCLAKVVLADNTLYVQSAKAKLLDSPSFKSKLLSNLERGARLHVVDMEKRWVRVKYNDQMGWVSRLLVSPSPPVQKNSILLKQKNNAENKARRRASSTATAAATRGFRSEQRSRASDLEHGNYEALKKVESLKIDDAEAWNFHREGIKK